MMTSEAPTFLRCPFSEKEAAKERGAKWDRARKAWFVPAGTPLAPFAEWLPAGAAAAPPPRSACAAASPASSSASPLPRTAPRTAPPDFAVILEVEEDDEALRSALAAMEAACDPRVHAHCFQQAGTRHLTLYTLKGVPRATAERIRFGAAAPPPALPLRVCFSRPHEWANALALAVDAESEVRLRQAIAACASGLEGLPPRGKAGAKPWTQRYGHAYEAGELHLTLYRVRDACAALGKAKPAVLDEFERARRAVAGASLGSVKGVRISIKEVGGPYDACRPLAGSLAPG